EVTLTVEDAAGPVQVSLGAPGATTAPIPTSSLYSIEAPPNGLIGSYRQGTGWEGPAHTVQIDWFIIPNDILPPPFSIEWRGKVEAPVAGNYTFGTNSDDGSYVYIDGQLVVDNGGSHGAQYRDGSITLAEGYHDIVVQYFQQTGSRQMELWWTPPGAAREIVPTERLWTGLGKAPQGMPLARPVVVSPVPLPSPAPLPPLPAASSAQAAFQRAWGSQGSQPGQFDQPRGVAYDAQGNIYVADMGNLRVQKFAPDGSFLLAFGAEAELQEPFDLVVDAAGQVFVLDPPTDGVAIFGPDGTYRGRIGQGINMFRPRGIGVDQLGNLYVADTGGSRVLKLAPNGQVLAEVCAKGEGPGQVTQPTDVAVGPDGTIYVADPHRGQMQRLDAAGRYLNAWSIPTANTFDCPRLAVMPNGLVLATDPEGHQVMIYDAEGRVMASFGGQGAAEGQFAKPIGIAAAADGQVVVADPLQHRVQVFSVAID
ncbi:MAG: hypothetical protein GX605_00695, partial [Chloroflexi bacterium]|nr:hypothetical protein [Chloroflexota bacterium]